MSDRRWSDVESNVASAVKHFRYAIEIDRDWRASRLPEEFYVASMAFMHAMLAGHTSTETALTRILDMLEEDRPVGPDWHDMLIRRLSRGMEDEPARPALLSEKLAAALIETKNFRHRAMHTYDNFTFERAAPALEAAALVIDLLPSEIDTFRAAVDP